MIYAGDRRSGSTPEHAVANVHLHAGIDEVVVLRSAMYCSGWCDTSNSSEGLDRLPGERTYLGNRSWFQWGQREADPLKGSLTFRSEVTVAGTT